MGLARLLRGSLDCYSKQVRLVNIQQKVFQNASISTMVKRVARTAGHCGTMMFVLKNLRGVAHRLPAARHVAHAQSKSKSQPQPQPQSPRDIILFEHDRTRFSRLLVAFCSGQLLFWTYLAHFAYTGLRDTSQEEATAGTTMWSFDINLGSSVWRYVFTMGCLAIGAGIATVGLLFSRHCVSRVVLHQGGAMVTIFAQSPFGLAQGWKIKVPLTEVACHAHRHESPSFVPLKIKGHRFYFLLDKEGTVNNLRLFENTVGAYRPI